LASPHQPAASSIDFLRTRTVFRELSRDVFEKAASLLAWVAFDQNEVVFSEGDRADRLFIVIHGRLAITRRDSEGGTQLLGWVTPGDSVGELALLGTQQRTATVSASRATVAVALSFHAYEKLANDLPQSLAVLNRLLAIRLEQVITGAPERNESSAILSIVAASADAPLATV
jgi:CRP-like cAMP-binding protein